MSKQEILCKEITMCCSRIAFTFVMFFFAWPSISHALPVDRAIIFRLFEDPNDHKSSVLYTIKLSLVAKIANNDSIGWEVAQVGILQHAFGATTEHEWSAALPFVAGANGLWWVPYSDPENPVLSEFTMPPRISAVADAVEPSGPGLDLYIEGATYGPPKTGLNLVLSAPLDYSFLVVGNTEPEAAGLTEPVEIDEDMGEAEIVAGKQPLHIPGRMGVYALNTINDPSQNHSLSGRRVDV